MHTSMTLCTEVLLSKPKIKLRFALDVERALRSAPICVQQPSLMIYIYIYRYNMDVLTVCKAGVLSRSLDDLRLQLLGILAVTVQSDGVDGQNKAKQLIG